MNELTSNYETTAYL